MFMDNVQTTKNFQAKVPIATPLVYLLALPVILLGLALLWPILEPVLVGLLQWLNHPLMRGF